MTMQATPTRVATDAPVREAAAVIGGWLASAREDPTTSLVCWPDFYAAWPALALADLEQGHQIGLAIGDVDDLTGFVETANTVDPSCWGHLAGNQFMAAAGQATRAWLADQRWARASVATFGGDEIVLAARISSPARFLAEVSGLYERLNATLPRTISWAVTWIDPAGVPALGGDGQRLWLTAEGLGRLDRALFHAKRTRAVKQSFVVVLEPKTPSREA